MGQEVVQNGVNNVTSAETLDKFASVGGVNGLLMWMVLIIVLVVCGVSLYIARMSDKKATEYLKFNREMMDKFDLKDEIRRFTSEISDLLVQIKQSQFQKEKIEQVFNEVQDIKDTVKYCEMKNKIMEERSYVCEKQHDT